ncbi:MAG: aldehyde dehydrogenase family protein [Alphaproteobacteria bacterium]|nr:aldehyde dehydrogenase family protein [Alphaproteobacteria bacterium]
MSAQPTAVPHRIVCTEPATLAPLGEVPVDDAVAVREAIAAARAAQVAFGAAPVRRRVRVLRRLLDLVVRHADELCEVVARDAGKTLEHALVGEIWPVAEKLRWTIRNAARVLADEPVPSGLLVQKRARICYPPRGVVGVICPWNYPLQNVFGPTISALAAGNGVVVKVSEHVAWSGARIQQLFDEALAAEGFDPALVRLVHGYGATGEAVVREGSDLVVFTGSLPNGRKVAHAAADAMIPCILELGGKDPFLVCEDAHLERALHALLVGVFVNAGQNCLSSERILVHEVVYARFEAMVVEAVGALRCGPPLGGDLPDVGAIISPHQLDLIASLVDDAVARGARVLVGGRRLHEGQGQFYAPTVLADVPEGARILAEETFGPVVVLVKVRDDAHALSLANGTEYALGATVISRSRRRGRRLAEALVAGSVLVNDFGMAYMIQDLPFGGVRGSGHGRLNGRDGLRAMCASRSVVEDRFPFLPPNRLFPTGRKDLRTFRALIRFVYRRGPVRRLLGLLGLLWARRP